MLKRFWLVLIFIPLAFRATADNDAFDPLVDALQLRAVFAVMQDEGQGYGHDLDRELLGNTGGLAWQEIVTNIYQPDRIWRTFLPRFTTELTDQDINTMTTFLNSDLGQQITTLELQARKLMLDKTFEEDSRVAYRAIVENPAHKAQPRLKLLVKLVEANDLVEYNVMGAMNASYAFYTGMIKGNAFDHEISQADVLKDVWSQEDKIRLDTKEWIFAYLLLAYAPLTDAELQTYIDFSSSESGRALNTALFAGYDEVFIMVSKALGLSVALEMQSENL